MSASPVASIMQIRNKHIIFTADHFCARTRDDFYKDLLRFDTQLQRWDTGFEPVPFAEGRAYHAAAVLGSNIWLTGGNIADKVFSDILVFDTLTLAWERVTLRCHVNPVSFRL